MQCKNNYYSSKKKEEKKKAERAVATYRAAITKASKIFESTQVIKILKQLPRNMTFGLFLGIKKD